MNTVIFSAPSQWGKTRNSEKIKDHFGCATVVDEWSSTKPIKMGALHLTESRLLPDIPDTVRVVFASSLDMPTLAKLKAVT